MGGFGVGSCFGCNQKINPKDCNIFGKKYKNNCTADETQEQTFQWSIVDKVRVPNVPPGDYVVSFRWDSEQTPQVWASCSDVKIKVSGTGSKPFTPTRGCTQCCVKGGICSNCTGCINDKSGDCAYCWKPLEGYAPGVPPVSCLGHDTASGH